MEWETLPTNRTDSIEDVQGQRDARRMAIDAVGIRGLKLPIRFEDAGEAQHTVAEVSCRFELPAERRGTHMSRFVALLSEQQHPLSARALPKLLAEMAARLEARISEITFDFPFFVQKKAPISGVGSPMDYRVRLQARLAGGTASVTTDVTIPVTSLCPCSKKISDYGAHNQRSHVTINCKTRGFIWIEELIEIVEQQA